jgi:glycerol-1-phosphate dehydrogenase [NAD(P)+]
MALTAAGVGDVVAALSSLPDWYLQHKLGLDPAYTELAGELMGPLAETLRAGAAGIRSRSLEGMALLAKLLALGGLAMALSHSTAPMSGVEHGLSHLWDMLAGLRRRPAALHGLQVGLATVLTAEAFRILVEEFDPAEVDLARCYPTDATMRTRLRAALDSVDASGRAAAECWPDYQAKLEAWHAHRADLAAALRDWPAVRAGIAARAGSAETVAGILQDVGAPLAFDRLAPPLDEAQVKFAFLNAPFVRRRPMLCDLWTFFDWDAEALWARAWSKFNRLRVLGEPS